MKISEAVKKAMEQHKLIYRNNIRRESGRHNTFIKPTNSYDACIIVSYNDGKEIASC